MKVTFFVSPFYADSLFAYRFYSQCLGSLYTMLPLKTFLAHFHIFVFLAAFETFSLVDNITNDITFLPTFIIPPPRLNGE